MNTISKKLIEERWEGKVKIFEVTEFSDDRGMVSEVFRKDDEITERVQQCYISETNPFVLRGPHQHPGVEWIDDGVGQCDNFVTWKAMVCYELFNFETKEFMYHITDPNKITLVQVDTPIVHGYRNLEFNRINTMNFPTQLFKGHGKNKEPDEVRHEELCHEKNKALIIFGANGRLGSALLESAYNHVGFYEYEIIPIFKKCNSKADIDDLFDKISSVISQEREVYFFNAAGATNVQNINKDEAEWVNVDLPVEFAKRCSELNYKFVAFSSDYVFKKSNLYNVTMDTYTLSKQRMETELEKIDGSVKIFRVANLFSSKENDLHNMIIKFKTKVALNEPFEIDNGIVVCPTDVNILAEYLINDLVNNPNSIFYDKKKSFNIVPENTYTVKEFVNKYFPGYDNFTEKKSLVEPWFDSFNKNSIKIPSSEGTIESIININN